MSKVIRILELYPSDMNLYGDRGNALALKRRLEWHGYTTENLEYNSGGTFPEDVDIVVGGGGQDSSQERVQFDLIAIADKLKSLAEEDVPILAICGLYQLLGHFFKTKDGAIIKGIGLLDIETHGGQERLTGNTIIHNELFGDIAGYENHSGLTYLRDGAKPFASIVRGAGNNGKDNTEGAMYKNVIGTYLHGPLLPNNPQIADYLIQKAVERRYESFTPSIIDDTFADKARAVAMKRPR